MIEFFKRFFTDGTFFARSMKAVAYGGALAVGTGQVPGLPPWVGPVVAALGATIKAGDKTPNEIQDMTPEDLNNLRLLVEKHRAENQ